MKLWMAFVLVGGLFLGVSSSAGAAPGAAELRGVERTQDGARFRFDEVSDSTWYYVWVNESGKAILKRWYKAEDCSCDGSECSIDYDHDFDDDKDYVVFVKTYSGRGHGPWSQAHEFDLSAPRLHWVDALQFVGTDAVVTALDAPDGMPSGLAISKGDGASAPIVEQGIGSSHTPLAGVRLCYEATGPDARIAELSLHQLSGTADDSTELVKDTTVRDSVQPECIDLLLDDPIDPTQGPVRLRVGLGLDGTDSVVLLSLAVLKGKPGAEYGKKVKICKVPPGNPSAAHTIFVAAPAVPAHLAKGSYLGDCR